MNPVYKVLDFKRSRLNKSLWLSRCKWLPVAVYLSQILLCLLVFLILRDWQTLKRANCRRGAFTTVFGLLESRAVSMEAIWMDRLLINWTSLVMSSCIMSARWRWRTRFEAWQQVHLHFIWTWSFYRELSEKSLIRF